MEKIGGLAKCRPNFWPPTIRAVTFGLWAVMASACHAGEQRERRQPGASSANSSDNVPANLTLCRDCPEFVHIPTPPAALRNIRHVAKYELTWKNYLAAFDARACPIPKVEVRGFGSAQPRYIQIKPADFRLDWPITELTPDDVECYLRWLTTKTRYKVALPTANEWEWFARAGNPAARFPWGDDADAGHEQLYGTPTNDADVAKPSKDGFVFPSRRVGRFPPNAWGIHDLMGNVRELTSNVLSGEEWASRFPSDQAGSSGYSRVVIKGSNAWSRQWAADGVAREFDAVIANGRYSTDVGVRVVLIEDDGAQ